MEYSPYEACNQSNLSFSLLLTSTRERDLVAPSGYLLPTFSRIFSKFACLYPSQLALRGMPRYLIGKEILLDLSNSHTNSVSTSSQFNTMIDDFWKLIFKPDPNSKPFNILL
ncbi:hypothetical protein PIB30_075666 [Stylosanthes scabra]|uniref:Uncharacterized protein n=1 Tax=Stylosanthes scabra TaxID=79078 RepID=A0ABU6UQQ3_9FABA|nr:hypothetical protein [Stylosanthes scabra]